MAAEYTLWMQKDKDGSPVKDSLGSFGFAACQIPWPSDETEEVTSRVWPGEDGEDAYIPQDGLRLKAHDLTIEFCYKGEVNTAYAAYKALRSYLTGMDGSGGKLAIYDPYWGKGRKDCYLKKISDLEPHRSNVDEVLSAKVTLRVCDPASEIGVTTNDNGIIVNLKVI